MDFLYVKQLLVRTPLEGLARRAQFAIGARHRRRHPELRDVYLESARIEQVMERIIKPDSNCIDVGCHIGSTLSDMLKLAPRGKHLAFEPVPRKAAWLRRKFPEVTVHEAAVADSNVAIPFVDNQSRPGFSGFGARRANGTDQVREISVQCKRLDDLGLGKIDFIKIDVEGAELMVLRGGREMILRDKPTIVFESGPGAAARLGLADRDLFGLLNDDLKYRVYFLKDFLGGKAPLDLAAFEAAHVYPFKAFNYVAAPSA
jgi:FkbM family methyltransferase